MRGPSPHFPLMPGSFIPDLLHQRGATLLQDWVREQLSADTVRSDLLNESELKQESARFLNALGPAMKEGNVRGIHGVEFAPVLAVLRELSASRGRQGFSPTETGMFVLSLKTPLFAALREAYGAESAALIDDLNSANALLDKLGLYTTEVYLQTREEVIRRQQEEMLELSTPVVKLWDGIVALPLIGTLDSARTSIVMETLLQTIVSTRSEIAIIDITGVPTVDTVVAQHLLKTVAAARLMGADCIISGIRPQIAQTMVHLQIDLSTVLTRATMAEALKTALKRLGLGIGRVASAGKPGGQGV